jgi:hypothetical protein
MSIEEEVNELMGEYEKITRPLFKLNEYNIEKEYNKKCCLFLADKMLQEHFFDDTEYSNRRIEYWQQFKTKIQNL